MQKGGLSVGVRKSSWVARGRWLALAAAFLGWMFDGFEMGIFSVVGRPALRDVLAARTDVAAPGGREASEAEVGQWFGRITATFLVGAALGGWAFGWLGDRLGRVRAMVLSVLAYSLFTALCGLARGPWELALLRFLAALGMGGEWALGVALVMECWPAGTRPVLGGLIGAASNVGFLLAPLPVVVMQALGVRAGQGGWRWVLGACAFPALFTFFLRVFVPESEKWQDAVRATGRAGPFEIFKPGIRGRTLLGALLGGIALGGTWGSVQWIAPWVSQATGSEEAAGRAQMASALGAVVGSFLGSVIGVGVPRRWTYFVLSIGSLGLCQFLFRYFGTRSPGQPFFLPAVFLVGGFTAAFYGWLPLYLPELFPTRVRASGQGFAYNAGRLIAAAGALYTGGLMGRATSYAQAGAVTSLVYVLGLAVIWFAPETRGKGLPE